MVVIDTEAARKVRTVKFKKPGGSGFSMKKTFLVLLVIACLAATMYTGYLLFTRQTNPTVGTIILLANIGVLIWNISVLRKYRVGVGTIISILVVIALLGATISAFAGVEPFSDAKAEVVAWFQKAGSQTPEFNLPPASEYPADISGRVTVTETVMAKYDRNKPDKWELTPKEGQIFWIVDISVKNKSYENAVTASYKDWVVAAGDKVYQAPGAFMDIWPSSKMSVPLGQTGRTTFRFSIPNILQISEAKICYQGQEPYSYGSLSSGEKVAVYDWDLKKAIVESKDEASQITKPAAQSRPQGFYVCTVMGGGKSALEFEGDRMTITDNFYGKRVFRYEISSDGISFDAVDVISGEVHTAFFRYNQEEDCVLLRYPILGILVYWKE